MHTMGLSEVGVATFQGGLIWGRPLYSIFPTSKYSTMPEQARYAQLVRYVRLLNTISAALCYTDVTQVRHILPTSMNITPQQCSGHQHSTMQWGSFYKLQSVTKQLAHSSKGGPCQPRGLAILTCTTMYVACTCVTYSMIIQLACIMRAVESNEAKV